ncbi:MAG: S8 family serine peptidase [Rubrivivax sp.]|nr:S8 family serine peptidase [Rubrivivax sp.]
MIQHKLAKNALLLGALLAAYGASIAQTAVSYSASALALPAPVTGTQPSKLQQQTGQVQVAVRLADAPLAIAVGANAKRLGSTMTLAQRQAYMASIKSKQDALMAQIRALGGTELARVGKAYNALVISADASKLAQIAKLPGVTALRPVIDHQISLTTTVPYIGAKALQDLGLTGAGVKIAVLDSGIDYTHKYLGGSGLVADFTVAAAAAAGAPPAGLFPTAKVIGGYDFVGENWPNTPLAPDANPIDAGIASSHGTHVADIAAGASLDGTHKGVAPGAQLYAVKVCSSVSTSCSGVAILQGLDWVMDPRGDLSFIGAADVVNLSLGANYGQRENPSTEAVSNVVRFGIVTAVAAGNAGDRPYIVSSPSNAAEAISVAQTAMPTAGAIPLVVNSPPSIAGVYSNTATVDWAPIVSGFTGNVRRAGATGSLASLACTPADTIDFTGTVALIDRGTCSISVKVANAAAKGAMGVLISLVAAGDAITFSYGGGAPLVETLVITQATGTTLKGALASGDVSVTVSLANSISLAGSMASTSARGPNYNFSTIKPEIGAPGASVSAVNGTGTGAGGFGGTSGATPMIAGSAALLLQKFPNATPPEIKSRLMNAANQAVYTNPATLPGELAPISRIGGGEVRVDKAASVTTGIWDATNPYNVGLSFGTLRAIGLTTMSKKVAVRNYSATPRTYTITPSFRYANDAASGAVQLTAPATITVPANGSSAFVLTMKLDAAKLPAWNLGAASTQGTGSRLQGVEFDGYVTVADGTDGASVPWHILPHKAHNVVTSTSVSITAGGQLNVSNTGGAVDGLTDVFALTGTSPKSATVLPPYGGGQVLIDMKAAGVRQVDLGSGTLGVQFAVATFGERAHPAYPAEYDIYIDSNNDGNWDYVIYNAESGGFGVSGQTVVYVYNFSTGISVGRYYAAADLNSSNMIYTVLGSDIGIASSAQKFSFAVYSFDNYFTGDLTDSIGLMTHTLGTPKYSLNAGSFITPINGGGALTASSVAGGAAASPSQSGFLLMHTNARTNRESDLVTVTP